MKKLFYLLFLLPLAFFASCNDDDDLAQVDFEVTLSNVTMVNNNYYAVAGEVVNIDGVSVKSLTDKAATVIGVRYFLDGYPIWASVEEGNFNFAFSTEGMETGTHNLAITATVLQVDKSITSAALNVPITIVENAESLPSGAPEIGTYSITVRMDAKN